MLRSGGPVPQRAVECRDDPLPRRLDLAWMGEPACCLQADEAVERAPYEAYRIGQVGLGPACDRRRDAPRFPCLCILMFCLRVLGTDSFRPMRPLREHDIRASFVNCSKGEAKRLAVPRDLADRPWDELDFLGWRDPAAPDRSYLVAERDGRALGVALRFPTARRGGGRRGMCSLCLTTHPADQVCLMTARRAGSAGREGNSVGIYMCADLACSLYVRGKKIPEPGGRFEESLTVEEQIERTRAHLFEFLDKVLA